MTLQWRDVSRMVLLAVLAGCPPAGDDGTSTTALASSGATASEAVTTSEAGSSSGAATTSDASWTSGAATSDAGSTSGAATSDSGSTSGAATSDASSGGVDDPCGCPAGEICVQVKGPEGQCHELECRPDPYGCVLGDPFTPCSPECREVCGSLHCSQHELCAARGSGLICSDSLDGDWHCDLFEEFGSECIEGKKCAPDADEGGCVPIDDPADGLDEPCVEHEVSDSCVQGAICLGTCELVCDPEDPACPMPDAVCAGYGVGVCVQPCNPLASECPPGEVCTAVILLNTDKDGEQFGCFSDMSGGGGQALTECTALNGCDTGLVCLESNRVSAACEGSQACCTPVCDLKDPDTCPAPDQVCKRVYPINQAPPGLDDVGVCVLP